MPLLATRVEPKPANLWRWHLRPKQNEGVPQCPLNSVAIHGPLTLPGDTCSCHVGTLRLDVGTSVRRPTPREASSQTNRESRWYPGSTRSRPWAFLGAHTYPCEQPVCVCVCVCVCAWSARTHRERSQPLPSSPGVEIWRPEVLGSNWFWRFLPLLPREAFSVSSSA